MIIQCFFGVLNFRKKIIFSGIFCHKFPIFFNKIFLSIFEKRFIGVYANKGETTMVGKHQRILFNTKKNIK